MTAIFPSHLCGSALAKFGFITVPGGRGGWGPAGLSRPCLQEAPMRSSNTRSSGRWTGPGFCVTRPSSCRSLKQRTIPATSTVSRDPGSAVPLSPRAVRGLCRGPHPSSTPHPGPGAADFLSFPGLWACVCWLPPPPKDTPARVSFAPELRYCSTPSGCGRGHQAT